MDLYVLGLVAGILAYFNGLVWVWCEILRLVVVLPDLALWRDQPRWMAAYLVFLVVATAALWRLCRHIARGVQGLVTSRFDESTELAGAVELRESDFGDLHGLVRAVARRIDAPEPDHIYLSPVAECYVAEQRRFSLSTDRELLLVLGMPHLAVLRIGELEVILGHELAHLRGGDTLLGVFVFRFLELLRMDMDEHRDGRWRWGDPLYWIEHLYFSCFVRLVAPLRRHQELAADRLSASAFGGPLAVQTLLKEWLLAHQFDAEMAALREEPVRNPSACPPGAARSAPRPTVYSRFGARWPGLTPAGQLYLERRLAEEEQAGVFDSHPTMAARIAAMRPFEARPAINVTPAAVLLEDQREPLERLLNDWLVGGAATAVAGPPLVALG